MKYTPDSDPFWTKNGDQRLRIDGNALPSVQECIDYIKGCGSGWTFLGRNAWGRYGFKHDETGRTEGFSLRELRLAKVYGW
jgi:hypothetical protein